MECLDATIAPIPGESLGTYVRRLRREQGLTQAGVAQRAKIHPQSLGKLERDQTGQLNHKTKRGLAQALGTTEAYLEAACAGQTVDDHPGIQFCPECWVPGTPPHSLWLHLQARHCLFCGTALRSHCVSCDEPISSLKHRFCPYCGTSYKATVAADPN